LETKRSNALINVAKLKDSTARKEFRIVVKNGLLQSFRLFSPDHQKFQAIVDASEDTMEKLKNTKANPLDLPTPGNSSKEGDATALYQRLSGEERGRTRRVKSPAPRHRIFKFSKSKEIGSSVKYE
jgi:hypothetical protein